MFADIFSDFDTYVRYVFLWFRNRCRLRKIVFREFLFEIAFYRPVIAVTVLMAICAVIVMAAVMAVGAVNRRDPVKSVSLLQ